MGERRQMGGFTANKNSHWGGSGGGGGGGFEEKKKCGGVGKKGEENGLWGKQYRSAERFANRGSMTTKKKGRERREKEDRLSGRLSFKRGGKGGAAKKGDQL